MQGRPRPTSRTFEWVRLAFRSLPEHAEIHLIRRCWDDFRRESTVKQRSVLLNGPCGTLAQKCAHGRADPANMSKKLIIFVGPWLDGNSSSEADVLIHVRHSFS